MIVRSPLVGAQPLLGERVSSVAGSRALSTAPKQRFQEYVALHPEFYADALRAKKRAHHLLSRIENAQGRERRWLCHQFLKDSRVRLNFTWRSVVRRKCYTFSPSDIRQLAKESNAFGVLHEQVTDTLVRRWDRKPRKAIKPGVRRLALQLQVQALLGALRPPNLKCQHFGKGVPSALKAVEGFIQAGYTHGAEIDVVSFYPSIACSDELKRLLWPLPETVLNSVVFDPKMISGTNAEVGNPNSGRRRLPIGSACSPAVGETVMRAILGSQPDRPVVNYHDNVFVFGHSQGEVNALIETIRESAHNFALGFLEFGPPIHWSRPEPLTFLGQTLDGLEPKPRWKPSEKVLSRYLSALEEQSMTLSQLDQIIRGLPAFRRAYADWDEGDEWLIIREAEFCTLAYFRTGTTDSLRRAVAALRHALTLDPLLIPFDFFPAVQNESEQRRRDGLELAILT